MEMRQRLISERKEIGLKKGRYGKNESQSLPFVGMNAESTNSCGSRWSEAQLVMVVVGMLGR